MSPFRRPHLSHRLVLVASGGVAFRGPPALCCRRSCARGTLLRRHRGILSALASMLWRFLRNLVMSAALGVQRSHPWENVVSTIHRKKVARAFRVRPCKGQMKWV